MTFETISLNAEYWVSATVRRRAEHNSVARKLGR
jgi:hypothetical protein